MKFFVFVFIIICSLSAQSQDIGYSKEFKENESVFTPKTYAIVVGVSEYSKLSNSSQLNFADDDALMMVDYLRTWDNIEIQLFTNGNATNKDLIGSKIAKALNIAKANDKVIIYFSGHGDINNLDNDGYLLLSNVDKPTDVEYTFSDALPIKHIKSRVRKASERNVQVYLIFDACKSGFANEETQVSNVLQRAENGVLMLSSKSNQLSEEHADIEHGVFTYYLVNGMKGLADFDNNSLIEKNELEKYVYDNIKIKTNGKQTPIISAPAYDYIISEYVSNELYNAEMDLASNITVKSAGQKSKGSANETTTIRDSDKCLALLELLRIQSDEGVFFPDDVNASLGAITIGKAISRSFRKTNHTGFNMSKYGSYYGLLNEGKVSLYSSYMFDKTLFFEDDAAIKLFCFSENEEELYTVNSNNSIRIWNTRTSDLLKEGPQVDGVIDMITPISSNFLAICLENGKVITYDIAKAEISNTSRLSKSSAKKLYFENDRWIAIDKDNKLSVINDKTSETEFKLKGVKSFVFLNESNRLVVAQEGRISLLDMTSFKVINSFEIKMSVSEMILEPFEQFCMVGHTDSDISILNLKDFKFENKGVRAKEGVDFLYYNFYDNIIVKGKNDGEVSVIPFSINYGEAALNINQRLKSCSSYEADVVNGELILGLNKQVTPVIRSLIKEEGIKTLEDIFKARRFAVQALKMDNSAILDVDKLEINKLLLDVYEILLTEDKIKYSDGIQIVKRIIELDPDGSYAFNISAQLYQNLDDMVKAKEYFEIAESKAPNWISPKMQNGEILLAEGDYKNAEVKFSRVIELDPNFTRAYQGLIEVYSNSGDKMKENLESLKNKNSALIDSLFPHVNDLLSNDKKIDVWKKYRKYELAKNGLFKNKECYSSDCWACLYNAFNKRGSYPVANKVHENAVVSFMNEGESFCISAKVEVDEGYLTKIYLKKTTGDFEEYKEEFYKDLFTKEKPKFEDGMTGHVKTKYDPPFTVYIVGNLIGGSGNLNNSNKNDNNVIRKVKVEEVQNVKWDTKIRIGDKHAGGIVFYVDPSKEHGLVYADLEKMTSLNWDDANNFCKNLNMQENADWFMPTLDQLSKLSTSGLNFPEIVLWSSNEGNINNKDALWFDTGRQASDVTLKTNKRFVIPVRKF